MSIPGEHVVEVRRLLVTYIDGSSTEYGLARQIHQYDDDSTWVYELIGGTLLKIPREQIRCTQVYKTTSH